MVNRLLLKLQGRLTGGGMSASSAVGMRQAYTCPAQNTGCCRSDCPVSTLPKRC